MFKKNKDGLYEMKPTTFSITPDSDCCSLNRLKTVQIEQGDQIVFLYKSDIMFFGTL